ncbi:hypothetical protein [Nitrincola sp. MINF-07-Sa-05]|uniref:hypothetical protein n=1 Tax=Nitrincola salilacus TaxID=3400273 RepID=UPI003917EAC7
MQLVKKIFIFLFVAILIFFALIIFLYLINSKGKDESYWIYEQTSHLKEMPDSDGAVFIESEFMHLYVPAAMGDIKDDDVKLLMANYCYEELIECVEINLIMANMFLSNKSKNAKKSVDRAKDALDLAYAFYKNNPDYNPVLFEATASFYELYKARNGFASIEDIDFYLSYVRDNLKFSDLNIGGGFFYSSYHEDICQFRMAVVANMMEYNRDYFGFIYLFSFVLDSKYKNI